jgi:hypothetical protein
MTEEDRFIKICGRAESNNNPQAWGDGGNAVGRFQDHASYYLSWGPKNADFGGHERSWDWCFEFAARRFFRAARAAQKDAGLTEIAMARHLHGQLRWDGWDDAYEKHWLLSEKAVDGLETA